jgi:hypothetical protein
MSAHSSPGGTGAMVAGIGLAASAYLLFSLRDATIKWLIVDFSAPQILFARSAAIVPFCLVLGGPRLEVRAGASPIRLQLVWRSLILLGAWLSYCSAARYLQLAEMKRSISRRRCWSPGRNGASPAGGHLIRRPRQEQRAVK